MISIFLTADLNVENHLNRQFKQIESSKAWISDIIYIPVKEGFIYLTTLFDLYVRMFIGWSLSVGMSTDQASIQLVEWSLETEKSIKDLSFILIVVCQ